MSETGPIDFHKGGKYYGFELLTTGWTIPFS